MTRKIDNKDYRYYVVTSKGIWAGNEYKSDAVDVLKELKEASVPAKVLARVTLKQMGLDPADNASWMTGTASFEELRGTGATPNARGLKRSMHREHADDRLWIWHWVGGGYNSTWATSKAEAIRIAKSMEIRIPASSKRPRIPALGLILDEKTLHEGTPAELARLDKQFEGMFYANPRHMGSGTGRFVIVRTDGMFWTGGGNRIYHWSEEYPDAKLFSTEASARKEIASSETELSAQSVEIVRDYGMADEELIIPNGRGQELERWETKGGRYGVSIVNAYPWGYTVLFFTRGRETGASTGHKTLDSAEERLHQEVIGGKEVDGINYKRVSPIGSVG